MISYFNLFPQKVATELRTVRFVVPGAFGAIPLGTIVFDEYFCEDLSCDCNRVFVKALYFKTEESEPKEVATISYTWSKSKDKFWNKITRENSNPFLDPLHRKASYAQDVLECWTQMIKKDREYHDRLIRHSKELRVQMRQTTPNVDEDRRIDPPEPEMLNRQGRRAAQRMLKQKKRREDKR